MNVRDPFDLHHRSTGTIPALDLLRRAAAPVTTAAETLRDRTVEAVQAGTRALQQHQQGQGRRLAVEHNNSNDSNDSSDMSFAVPRNVPSFGNPQRLAEDHLWASSGVTSRSALPASSFSSSRGTGTGLGLGLGTGTGTGTGGGNMLHDVQDRVGAFLSSGSGSSKGGGGGLPMYKDKPYSYAPSPRARPLYRRKRVLAAVATSLVLLALWYLGFFAEQHRQKARVALGQWGWLQADGDDGDGGAATRADWLRRRERVVEAFELSWDSYERYAWGYDEYHPIAKTGKRMAPKGLGWIIIDSLDTLMLMNLTSQLSHAREWLADSLTWDQNQDVNTFETTIRMLGGLLAAHYLSNEFPELAPLADDDPGAPGEDLYLEKAKDLADRLMAAFDSPSGVPYASVNLGQFRGIVSHDDDGASSTAEATTLQLEFKYLAKLTGEKLFWDKAERVMQIVDDLGAEDGLVPIFIYATSGNFRGHNIRLGSRGDSYYEYLIKQYLQTNKREELYRDMWRDALAGVRKHLLAHTERARLTVIGERPSGLGGDLSPKMDHLVCFMPGTIALAATGGLTEREARKLPTWSRQDEADMRLARELMQTCWGMYKFMATGLAGEITYFRLSGAGAPEGADEEGVKQEADFDPAPDAAWRHDYDVRSFDSHNLQRPETVESLFYMWRITGDSRYREWGWEMFKSFMNHTAVEDGGGFTSLANANVVPPVTRDNMESFWLAETLKYFYLLFSPDDLLPLDRVVFNTEAHPLPRFDMAPLFETGWQRKARDAHGRIVAEKPTVVLDAEGEGSPPPEESSSD